MTSCNHPEPKSRHESSDSHNTTTTIGFENEPGANGNHVAQIGLVNLNDVLSNDQVNLLSGFSIF